jgi:hypothetical protein
MRRARDLSLVNALLTIFIKVNVPDLPNRLNKGCDHEKATALEFLGWAWELVEVTSPKPFKSCRGLVR